MNYTLPSAALAGVVRAAQSMSAVYARAHQGARATGEDVQSCSNGRQGKKLQQTCENCSLPSVTCALCSAEYAKPVKIN